MNKVFVFLVLFIGLFSQSNEEESIGYLDNLFVADIGIEVGVLVSGNQSEIELEPEQDYDQKSLVKVGLNYYFIDQFGVEGSFTAYSSTIATKKDYKGFGLFQEMGYSVGFCSALFFSELYNGFQFFSVHGGVTYTSLSLHDDFKDILDDNHRVNNKDARGYGYYLNARFNIYSESGLLMAMGGGYLYHSPKFAGAPEALDAGTISFVFSLGYALN